MARKPRELWAASYMFSHLMKCIYGAANKAGLTIISPAKPEKEKNKIGIYPDRIYFLGKIKSDLLESARNSFCESTKIPPKSFTQYFNVMSASCEAENHSKAIELLNQRLDVLELCNYGADYDKTHAILNLITKKCHSPLFAIETGNADTFPFKINTLAEIATAQLQGIDSSEWENVKDAARNLERQAEKKRKETEKADKEDVENAEYSIDINEDFFYKGLLNVSAFKENIKSHHKYFCVVQADGDNMGKVVSHQDLGDSKLGKISAALVQFGVDAAQIIEDFGGLPIYAGGDDLLFIAPVIGKDGTHIFGLLDKIGTDAFGAVAEIVRDIGLHTYKDGKKTDKTIEASLSFGISISYYKYPLYEALESARNLLFGTAKNIGDKKAVAWSLRKHSGGTFDAAFSLKNDAMQAAFQNLIQSTTKDTLVSAIAHKIRQEGALVKTVMEAEKDIPYTAQDGVIPERPRLNALFDKVLEFQDNEYYKAVKAIMPILYKEAGTDKFIQMLYSILRTAKFIKGEGLHDEE